MPAIGVISDTHGLLRSEAVEALRGSDLILHAGDIGAADILEKLRQLAPVVAVRGNVDRGLWAEGLPDTQWVDFAGVSIYLLHDRSTIDLEPAAARLSAIVFGHSHQPTQELHKGILYFNPGSAGPQRFKLPICVGRLLVSNGKLTSEIITLA